MGIPIRRTRTIMFVLVGIASAFATAGTCQVPHDEADRSSTSSSAT
jgi:ribose/xylose/arabinose/galactoside ABC-type transport system permease subunit